MIRGSSGILFIPVFLKKGEKNRMPVDRKLTNYTGILAVKTVIVPSETLLNECKVVGYFKIILSIRY